jgi:predicted nucleotidyltransferase
VYSIRSDRPLDRSTQDILSAIHDMAAPLALPIFVVGATARDILLTHVFGIETGRATLDVDFAVAVEHWPQFENIKQHLLANDHFDSATSITHRLLYRTSDNTIARPIDLIPFGGIEQPPATIKWPPDMAVMMNVAGYADAWRAAVEVEFAPGRSIRVASLAGLAVLKLIAWKDRGLEDPKDAEDLQFLLQNYASAGNLDRLYDAESALLESANYDQDLAGMALLGRDAATLAGPQTCEQCIALLDDTAMRDRLALHMARTRAGATDALDAAYTRLTWFRRGFELHATGSPSV